MYHTRWVYCFSHTVSAEEHAEIKELVHKAGVTNVERGQEFDEVITRAVTSFLSHAKEEEDEQHPIIREKLSKEDNDVRISTPLGSIVYLNPVTSCRKSRAHSLEPARQYPRARTRKPLKLEVRHRRSRACRLA